MGGSYKGGNEDTCPFLCRSLCYPYDGNCEYYCFCECKGFAIDCNKSFMVTKECKFILTDEKTKNIYDITDVVEIICDNIQEEIEERLS